MTTLAVTLLVAGVILPVGTTVHVFLSRRYDYAPWAKVAWVSASVAGIAWGLLDWIVLHGRSFQLTRENHYRLVGFRGAFYGVVIGIALSFALARRYRNVTPQKPEKG